MNSDNNNNTANMNTTPVSSPKIPTTPKTPARARARDLEDLEISDIELESPVLARAQARLPQVPEIIDLTNDVSSIDSDFENESVNNALKKRDQEDAEIEDGLSTDSEDSEDSERAVIIPCPASPTRLVELAQWHPLPEDSDDEEYGEKKPINKYSQEDPDWETGKVQDYKDGNPDETRHHWWKSTIFSDYTDNNQKEICLAVDYFEEVFQAILKLAGIICAIMGIEICPTTHRIYAHILLGFKAAKRYTTLKRKIGNGQLRYLLTDDQIISWYDYVIKSFSKINHPKRVLRWGEDKVLNKKHRISRTDKRTHRDMFYDNKRLIEEGRFEEIDPYFRFDHMSKIQKWYNDQHKAAIRVNHDRLVYIWGEPGVGKTSLFSRNIDPNLIYWKNPSHKWWGGYTNQPIIIIDEVTPEQFQSGNINWNTIGDSNEVYVEVKGSQLPFQAQWVIVISNYSLDQLCTERRRGLNMIWKATFKRRCGNEQDGYRIYKFPANPPADNGDFSDVSHRELDIWKRKWYYDIKPFFNKLMNFPWQYCNNSRITPYEYESVVVDSYCSLVLFIIPFLYLGHVIESK